jgi:hypothetical protein
MFLLAKGERYYFDADAVRVPAKQEALSQYQGNRRNDSLQQYGLTNGTSNPSCTHEGGANIRTVFSIPTDPTVDVYADGMRRITSPDCPVHGDAGTGDVRMLKCSCDYEDSRGDGPPNFPSVISIPTESYKGSHFATFPRKLVEPCIRAGSSQRGVCPECGAPWEREVESERIRTRPGVDSKVWVDPVGSPYERHSGSVVGNRDPFRHVAVKSTVGWHPTCTHGHAPIPATVFDPFCGSATTGVVANALGRRFIGVDLSRDYLVNQASRRLSRPHAAPLRPERPEHHPLFDRGE